MPIGQRKMMKNAVECIWVSFECIVWLYVSVSFCVCVCEILEWIWMVGRLVIVGVGFGKGAGGSWGVRVCQLCEVKPHNWKSKAAIVCHGFISWFVADEEVDQALQHLQHASFQISRFPDGSLERVGIHHPACAQLSLFHLLTDTHRISQILKSFVLVFWPGLPDLAILCYFDVFGWGSLCARVQMHTSRSDKNSTRSGTRSRF
jgi:hypothetical protein